VFRGGGRVFGPKPRNYSFKLNTKVKQLARKSALAYKAQNDGLLVLEDVNFDNPKTKEFNSILENLKVQNEKVLFVLGEKNDNVYLSARNVTKTKIVTADLLNTYDVLNAKKIILVKNSLEIIEKILN
jgi:large subunit ribosomal protein L4